MAGVTPRKVSLGVLPTINKVIYVAIRWSGYLGPISVFLLPKPFHFSPSVLLFSLDSALERKSPSTKLWCGNHEIRLRNSNDPMLQVPGHLMMRKWEEIGKIQGVMFLPKSDHLGLGVSVFGSLIPSLQLGFGKYLALTCWKTNPSEAFQDKQSKRRNITVAKVIYRV